MVIRKRDDKTAPTIPPKMEGIVKRCAVYQQISANAGEAFAEEKEKLVDYLATAKNVDIETGKGFKTKFGTLTYTSRRNNLVDKDYIETLIEKGRLNITTLLQISKISASDLKTILSAADYGKAVKEEEGTSYLTIKTTPELKTVLGEAFAFSRLFNAKAEVDEEFFTTAHEALAEFMEE